MRFIAAHGFISSSTEVDPSDHTRLCPARSKRGKGGFSSSVGSVSKIHSI